MFVSRCHALSAVTQHMSDADLEDADDAAASLQYRYRNYTEQRYSIFVDVVRMSVNSCPQVSSKVEKPLNLPVTVCTGPTAAADGRLCKLKVTLYPQVAVAALSLHLQLSPNYTCCATTRVSCLSYRDATCRAVFVPTWRTTKKQ